MSSVKARFNVSAPKSYTNRDGEEKKQRINVGRATQWDDGNISLEMHSMPVGNWFDGKLMLFPADEQKAQGDRPARQQRTTGDGPSSNPSEIPF